MTAHTKAMLRTTGTAPSSNVVVSRERESMDAVSARIPYNQVERLRALYSYGILDTPREGSFDDIVRLASFICQTPIAVVNLIDDGRQWFKAEVGLGIRETPLESSICAHAILQPGLLEVHDLKADARFRLNPLVTSGQELRFYAGALLQTPEGYALGTICVLDTTPRTLSDEQKNLLTALARQVMIQLELRRTIAIARRANLYRSRLMAVAGHDLKQPLQVATMVLGTLQLQTSDEPTLRRLSMALDAMSRLGSDLDRLAVASNFGQEADVPKIQRFQISEVLKSVVATWNEHALHRGITLRQPHCSGVVESDPQMLITILGNLVGNAIKYTPQGKVVIGCRRRKGSLFIEVIDSGIGIPLERQETLFNAFHQEDAASEGLGLGLSIVQRMVELLGYALRIFSVHGKGSRFSLEVPLAQPEPQG